MLGRRDSGNKQKQAIAEALLYSRSVDRKVQIISFGRMFFSVGTRVIPGPCAWPSFNHERSQVHHTVWSPLRFEFFRLKCPLVGNQCGSPCSGEDPGVGAGLELDPNSQSVEYISDVC